MNSRMFKLFFVVSIAVFSIGLISSYNSLQKSEEIVFNAWADLDANLQRRADLIPNLVNTVKGYMQFEANTLEAVIQARANASSVHIDVQQLSDPQQLRKFELAQQELQNSLAKLMVVVERYPDLKANQSFLDLQHQLEGTENRINFARQNVNAATRDFNYAIRKFPAKFVNKMFLGLAKKEFFVVAPEAQQNISVDFSTN